MEEGDRAPPAAAQAVPTALQISWRERLWTVPAETRLGVAEVAEAMGRPRSWVYRHTGPSSSRARIPHRKLDGALVFTAGEVRAWVQKREEVLFTR